MKVDLMMKVTHPCYKFKEINLTISYKIAAGQSIGLHNMEKLMK